MATVRKLKDGQGAYIFAAGAAGAPDTILGKPVNTDPNIAAVALGARSVLFGDFSQYFVRLASGVRFERSDDFAFATDLVTFRTVIRGDGDLIDLTGAVKCYVGNAA
jgi:HK97 family phage major capsid protein